MASRDRHPVTPAVRALRAVGAAFTGHLYDYVERGGTRASSRALGVEEHAVIKTLVFEDDAGRPLLVLMHGDREVSAKALARHVGARRVAPCPVARAEKHSGYQVGGTSPFATRTRMPVYMEESVGALERLLVNGGRRGFLIEMEPSVLTRVLEPRIVNVGIPRGGER